MRFGLLQFVQRLFGPVIGPKIGGTMKFFQELCGGKMKAARNDSMSFIDVRDTAAHHIQACANSALTGRFMSVVESWHWNKILGTIAKMCEWTEEPTLYTGPDEVATAKIQSRTNELAWGKVS